MPIHLDSHADDVDLIPGTTKSDIVIFLYNNPEYGYSPQEVSSELDIPHGTATTTLSRLHNDGHVGKTQTGYYYALEDRDDIRRYLSSVDQVHRLFGHLRDDSESHTDDTQALETDVDEEELEAELLDLEDELDGENDVDE